MTEEVITSLDQVSAAWLTAVLTDSGALDRGAVAGLEMNFRARELSTIAKLKVTYTAGAQGERPEHLFLKLVNVDQDDEFFGPSEVNYYRRDYVGLVAAPILRSYSAAFSPELGRYHVLMDDLSVTHVEAAQKAPTLDYGLALAEALANLHAHWWGAERLTAGGEPIPSAQRIRRFVEIAQPGLNHILAHCRQDLKPHWPAALYDLFEHHPRRLVERTQDGNGFTLIHGDVNAGNVFVPIHGNRPLYIVDRQPFDWSLTTWLGVYDLSYAIVARWPVQLRRQCERQLLQHYHNRLIANGVCGYSWEQLYEDYRLCAVISVYVAVEWCRGRFNEGTMPIWLPMLQKAMTAFDDLGCKELQ